MKFLNESSQEKIVQYVYKCSKVQLHEQVTNPEKDVNTRPKYEIYDFGVNSVPYKLYHEKYPMLMATETSSHISPVKTASQVTKNNLPLMRNFIC